MDTAKLSEIRRFFIQDNKVIPHPASNTAGRKPYISISKNMCDAFKNKFGDPIDFRKNRGFNQMGKALYIGMMLFISLLDDHEVEILRLDSTPSGLSRSCAARKICPTTSGRPFDVEYKYKKTKVKIGNVTTG